MAEDKIRIYKLPMQKIIEHGCKIDNYTKEQAMMDGELVPISTSQLVGKVLDYFDENGLSGLQIMDAIVNIVVPSANGKQADRVAESYRALAHTGFTINGRHYVRLCAGSGQLRHNTITFVWDVMHSYLTEALYCGITPEELGDSFSVSKWNAYLGLSESGMRFLKTAPRVCIVSDYEQIKPHMPIDYITTERSGGRKSRRVDKTITRYEYDNPEMNFAPLNSFDGQGLADPDWMRRIAVELEYLQEGKGYVPSEYILRAPWCKGLVVAFDFKGYCSEYEVTRIKDVYGKLHNIDDIDVLLSASQFKMWKAYREHGGWDYHVESMQKYNLRWGVVIANKKKDDDFRALNYQYLQALDIDDTDIDKLCKHTEDMLTKLCSGDIKTVYRTLVGFAAADTSDDGSEYVTEESKHTASLLQRVISHNYDLLQDAHIQDLIYREAESKFNGAKIGKLLCRGGYSFIVSDPVAQIQHIIKAHADDGDRDITVKGLVPPRAIYSAYWNNTSPSSGEVALMRSPLIDQSEVTICRLSRTPEMDKWFSHIKSGLILSIHDLNTLALQNCDFDGDRCFSTNDPVIIKGAQEKPVPILYPSAGAQLKGAITFDGMIDADVRGLNSAVGSLSNMATCLYAQRDFYQKGSPEYIELSRRIKIVSELVGIEIDKIKTGIPPMKPSAWNKERMPYEQYNSPAAGRKITRVPSCSPEEQDRIRRHNALIPEGKPLFMRYIYESMNLVLMKYDKAFDNTVKYNSGVRLLDLLNTDYDDLDEESQAIVDKYHRCLPAIDTPCTMNKICKRFEYLQRNLKRRNGARNMLREYATPQEFDVCIMKQISGLVDLFQRQKRFITRSNNTGRSNSNRQIAKETKERFDAMRVHIRNQIFELVVGDIQTAYNYLIELVGRKVCSESTVWSLLDDLILAVIPRKTYNEEMAA